MMYPHIVDLESAMTPVPSDDADRGAPNGTSTPPNDGASIYDTLIRKPSTFVLQRPKVAQVTPRAGTMNVGELVRLHIWIGGRPNPVLVEFTQKLLLGRTLLHADGPGLNLDEYEGYLYGVSRRHAEIHHKGELLHVMDLGSTNGTFLNGFQLQPNQPRILRDGDELSLGQMTLLVRFA